MRPCGSKNTLLPYSCRHARNRAKADCQNYLCSMAERKRHQARRDPKRSDSRGQRRRGSCEVFVSEGGLILNAALVMIASKRLRPGSYDKIGRQRIFSAQIKHAVEKLCRALRIRSLVGQRPDRARSLAVRKRPVSDNAVSRAQGNQDRIPLTWRAIPMPSGLGVVFTADSPVAPVASSRTEKSQCVRLGGQHH